MSLIARLPTGRLVAGAAVLVALCLAFVWFVPSGYYLYAPHEAQALASRVAVEGERAETGAGEILYVDITVRPASWLERLIPYVRPDGSTMVPEKDVIPAGTSIVERREDAQADMKQSEKVAAAVALKQAGRRVTVKQQGALVRGVAGDAPAARSLARRDVIVGVDGSAVTTPSDLRRLVGRREPGDTVSLRVRRDGRERKVDVRTIANPRDERQPLIGISVGQAADIELSLDVDIDLGDVGGPSAGLAFALDILEELDQNVDRGNRVAATGEIELDGSVRPVGAIKQKVFGVRKAGADVFLVPAGDNATEAQRYAGDLRVIPVENFQQALRELRTLPPKD